MNGTRKEREREFKRQEILSAAIEIFAAKGYNNATLDEIAEASEFGKGTLYNYFQNKQEIYFAIIENIFEQFVINLRRIDSESQNLKEFLSGLVKFMISYCVNNSAAFMIMAHKRLSSINEKSGAMSDRMKTLMEEGQSVQLKKIEKAIKKKEVREFNPNKLLDLIRGMVFSYVYNQLACVKDKNFDIDKESEFVLSVLFNGILKN